jgi:hypothetical protein
VAWKVIVAFALPIFAFTVGLASFEHLLGGWAVGRHRTLAAFALALAFTAGLMLVIRFLFKRCSRRS